VEDIQKGASKLRNRVIGRVFKELELIEQWRSGIHKIMTACREAGMEDPFFEEIDTRFRVTLRRGTVSCLARGSEAIPWPPLPSNSG
jgi:ATP-dependent DNA helicase RecG